MAHVCRSTSLPRITQLLPADDQNVVKQARDPI